MKNLLTYIVLLFIVAAGCVSINETHNFDNGQMNLVAYSDYGSITEMIIEKGEGEAVAVMGLLKDDGITPEGLSATWDENGEMLVLKDELKTVKEMESILLAYLHNDLNLKSQFE